jgi:hypothetical protein
MLKAEDFVPEGRDNHWTSTKTGMIVVGRSGMSLEELVAEINADLQPQ